MRTIVTISEDDVKGLAEVSQQEKISRAEAIRRAVRSYLKARRRSTAEAFGLWRGRGVDGLEYERTLREEW